MAMHRARMILIAGCLACSAGCAIRTPQSLTRVWCDWNTLGQHAVYLETVDHLPLRASRVDHFRWMYGYDPGTIFTGKQQTILHAQGNGGALPVAAYPSSPGTIVPLPSPHSNPEGIQLVPPSPAHPSGGALPPLPADVPVAPKKRLPAPPPAAPSNPVRPSPTGPSAYRSREIQQAKFQQSSNRAVTVPATPAANRRPFR
jgi:hypothetical protein